MAVADAEPSATDQSKQSTPGTCAREGRAVGEHVERQRRLPDTARSVDTVPAAVDRARQVVATGDGEDHGTVERVLS
nr:hypothetical protein [Cellulosimicrobium sp. MM]